jgi:hypothetical protein
VKGTAQSKGQPWSLPKHFNGMNFSHSTVAKLLSDYTKTEDALIHQQTQEDLHAIDGADEQLSPFDNLALHTDTKVQYLATWSCHLQLIGCDRSSVRDAVAGTNT